MSTEKLIIFDTTMRDGEQSPGAMMTLDEKLRIARQLERMRVDVIEAGFPASSNGDFEAVEAGVRVGYDAQGFGRGRGNHGAQPNGGRRPEKKGKRGPHQLLSREAPDTEKERPMCVPI